MKCDNCEKTIKENDEIYCFLGEEKNNFCSVDCLISFFDMKKLNFGCGEEILEGFDNIDIQESPKIQKSFDFNEFPYPIKDNFYDYVFSKSVLEHLEEPNKVLNEELWRICKKNAIVEIIVPYYNNKSAFADIQHKHYFSDTSFIFFVNNVNKVDKIKKFEIDELILVPTIVGRFFPKFLREKISLFVGGIISYIQIKLRVIKPQEEEK